MGSESIATQSSLAPGMHRKESCIRKPWTRKKLRLEKVDQSHVEHSSRSRLVQGSGQLGTIPKLRAQLKKNLPDIYFVHFNIKGNFPLMTPLTYTTT